MKRRDILKAIGLAPLVTVLGDQDVSATDPTPALPEPVAPVPSFQTWGTADAYAFTTSGTVMFGPDDVRTFYRGATE